jgi:hypothetical protein
MRTTHFKLLRTQGHAFFTAIALMMQAVITSETSVKLCETTRRNIPEDSHLHTRRHDNLKYHILPFDAV